MWDLENWYKCTYLQSRNRDTDREQTYEQQVGKGGGMNWETGMDIYTRLCIKEITNENQLYNPGTLLNVLHWQRGYMYTCGWFSLLYKQKLIQHCKATKKKKMLKVTNQQGNANTNHSEIPPHTY